MPDLASFSKNDKRLKKKQDNSLVYSKNSPYDWQTWRDQSYHHQHISWVMTRICAEHSFLFPPINHPRYSYNLLSHSPCVSSHPPGSAGPLQTPAETWLRTDMSAHRERERETRWLERETNKHIQTETGKVLEKAGMRWRGWSFVSALGRLTNFSKVMTQQSN